MRKNSVDPWIAWLGDHGVELKQDIAKAQTPEPVKDPEPVKEPDPVQTPEPVKDPEPAAIPEPVIEE